MYFPSDVWDTINDTAHPALFYAQDYIWQVLIDGYEEEYENNEWVDMEEYLESWIESEKSQCPW